MTISQKHPHAKTLSTYLSSSCVDKPGHFETVLVRIVFCSKNTSEGFVGYLPAEAPFIGVVREIGFELGFIEVAGSRISLMSRLK